jgi:predicted metal-dependent peptidase
MRTPSKPNARDITPEKLADLKRIASAILADTRMAFQRQFPFVGSVSMSMDLVPTRDPQNPTAATDGRHIFFDIAFLSELSVNDRMFILGHEVYHNVMMHFLRQGARDRDLWNIATDMEVNQMLKDDGLIPPLTALLPSKYGFPENRSAEEYYEMLLANQQNQQYNSSNNNSSSQKGAGQGGMPPDGDNSDSDDQQDADGTPTSSGNKRGELEGQFDRHIYEGDDLSKEPTDENMSDKYGKLSGHDEDFEPNVEKNTVEKIREAAISAAQTIERQRGELPGHLKRLVNELLEPEIDWKEILLQFTTRCMSNDATWNRPNRRFAYSGTYLPGHEGKMLKIAVGLDTSGSTAVDIKKFMSEVDGIVKSFGNYSLDVIQCDTEVNRVDHYDEDMPADFEHEQFNVYGGGGTRLTPIFDYVAVNDLEPDAVVIFTDGYCERMLAENAPAYPVLWVLTKENSRSNLGFGEIVEFKS